jgi:hypothetical protein
MNQIKILNAELPHYPENDIAAERRNISPALASGLQALGAGSSECDRE